MTEPAQPRRGFWTKVAAVLTTIVGLGAGAVGITRLYESFTLPGCDSSRTKDTLDRIIRDNKLESTGYADIKTVASTDQETSCTGIATLADGRRLQLAYRTFWEGSSQKVQVTGSQFQ